MALRYSGSLKITVAFDDRRSAYKASVSFKGRSFWSGYVGRATIAPARLAVDNPVAYDDAAHAALSFALNDHAETPTGYTVDQLAEPSGYGWAISRSAARSNPSPARRRPAAKRRTAKRTTRRTAKRTSKRPSAKRRTARSRTRR
jgi:hypothetical protein